MIFAKDFAKNFARNHEKKNNTWNFRCLVNESFVPSAKQTSILYCRLSDFRNMTSSDGKWQH